LAHSRVCNILQDKSQTLAGSTGGFTTYNTDVAGSVSKGHNIPCISHNPILEGKFLSRKCGLQTRKYGKINISFLI
jgi:hypothetical protein